MGMPRNADSMFRGVHYNTLTTPALREKMENKVLAVLRKIDERILRIKRLREEHGLSEAQMVEVVMRYRNDQAKGKTVPAYSNSSVPTQGAVATTEKFVPAGVLANAATEWDLIESERAEVERMKLILRNLKDMEWATHPQTGVLIERMATHSLSDDDMIYLGF